MIKDAATAQKAEKALTRTSCEPKLMDQATDSIYSPSLTNQRDYTMHRGVRRTQSGKWGAAIRHPFTKVSVWLGSYNTPKEAADAYIRKKVDFDSMAIDADTVLKAENALTRTCCEPKLMDQPEMNCEESNLHVTEDVKAPSVENKSHSVETELVSEAGISKVKVADMDDECRGSQVNVESIRVSCPSIASNENFDTGIINAVGELVGKFKRQDLDSMSPVEAVVTKEMDPVCGSKRARKQEMALTESVNEQVTCSRTRDVYQRKSGKWCAEIRNPMTKVEHSVDGYETTEEVIEVANSKRHEYPEMKKHKQSNVETELVSNSQDIVSEAGVSSVKVADSDDEDGGSQVSADSIQPPLSSFVTNQEFDTSSVINAYGELVGEFSRLDDELWLDVSTEI